MIVDGINYTGVSIEVFSAIQMVKGSQELVTNEALSKSIANVILESGLTPEENEQVFDSTFIHQDQRVEILEIVESMKIKKGRFDIHYMTLLGDKKFVKTVYGDEIASDICSKNNRTLTPLQMKLGMGVMFYVKRDNNESDT